MRGLSVFVLAGLVSVLAVPTAQADTAAIALDDEDAVLTEKDGGGWTTTVGFTNLTDAEIQLVPKAVAKGGTCEPTLDKNRTLPAARHRVFTVTIPSSCHLKDNPFAFLVEATAPPAPAASFKITATAAPDDQQPDWDRLWAFLFALVGLALLAIPVFLYWSARECRRIVEPLLYLDDTWSFKDSWVSNVTIGGGLLTGLFGSSEVVKTFLGEDADSAVALGTVGAAIAVAFVGAGGLVLLAFKSRTANSYTVFGLFAAAVVTLAGAVGELYVVYVSARAVTGDALHDFVLPSVALAGGLLLLGAGERSLLVTLDTGATKPPDPDYTKPPLTETIFAASMIVAALKTPETVDVEGVKAAIEGSFPEPSAEAVAAAPAPPPRRRASAML